MTDKNWYAPGEVIVSQMSTEELEKDKEQRKKKREKYPFRHDKKASYDIGCHISENMGEIAKRIFKCTGRKQGRRKR